MKTIAKSLFAGAVLASALIIASARASAEIGQPAPNFTLTDIAGKTHKLSDYKGKVVVLEWHNTKCPFSAAHYESRNMQDAQKAAVADGAIWLAINSSHAGSPGNLSSEQTAAWLQKKGAAVTACFRDEDGKVGRLYDAKVTPHMFIVGRDGRLVYNGAIDNGAGKSVQALIANGKNSSVQEAIDSGEGKDAKTVTNYVQAALASLKAGKPVEKALTRPYGCTVKYGKAT